MDIANYRSCMKEQLSKIKPANKLERKKAFCQFAKLCSGKVKTTDEAIALCKQKHPDWYV